MSKKPCPVEVLATSEYCRLTACLECGIVNLNLPGGISFRFEIFQFLVITNAFNRAAHKLKNKSAPIQDVKVIDFKRTH